MISKIFNWCRVQRYSIFVIAIFAILSASLAIIDIVNNEHVQPKYAQARTNPTQPLGQIYNQNNQNEDFLIIPGELLVTLRNSNDTSVLENLDQEKISRRPLTFQSQAINAIRSVLPNTMESSKIDNTYAIKLRDPVSRENIRSQSIDQNQLKSQGLEVKEVKLSQSPETQALKEKLQQNPNVAFVAYNRVYQTNNVNPLNDPLYNEQWHLNNAGQAFPVKSTVFAGGTNGQDIRAESLWAQDISNGADNLVVGVSDSGVDITHPDLEENIWINQGEIAAQQKLILDINNDGNVNAKEILAYFRDPVRISGMDFNLDGSVDLLDVISAGSILIDNSDQDSNGFTDDLVGWNFVDNNNNPIDLNGHGTHVAGIIAASSNQIGIRGVAYNAEIMPLRVGTLSGGISAKASIKANLYAEIMQPKVVNYSWGGDVTVSQDDPEVLSFNALSDNDIVLVGASGNDDIPASYFYPANLPNFISVAAYDSEGVKASFSNYGSGVDVSAPGVSILSLKAKNSYIASKAPQLVYQDKYIILSGTSMASPVVAGLAALIKSNFPTASANDVKQHLRNNTRTPDNVFFTRDFGYGLVGKPTLLNQIFSYPKISFNNISQNDFVEGNISIEATLTPNNTTFDTLTFQYNKGTTGAWTTSATDLNPIALAVNNFKTSDLKEDDNNYIAFKIDTPNFSVAETRVIYVDNVKQPPINFVIGGTHDPIPIENANNFDLNSSEYTSSVKFYPVSDPSNKKSIIPCAGSLAPVCKAGVLGYIDPADLSSSGLYKIEYIITSPDNGIRTFLASMMIDSRFKPGFPFKYPKNPSEFFRIMPSISPVVDDLDGDGKKETIFINTGNDWGWYNYFSPTYLYVLNSDGTIRPGFPFNLPPNPIGTELDAANNSRPLVYDINGDGGKEILFSSRRVDFCVGTCNKFYNILNAIDPDGQVVSGFPKVITDSTYGNVKMINGMSLSAQDLDGDGLTEIVFMDTEGDVVLMGPTGNVLPNWPISMPRPENYYYDNSIIYPKLGDLSTIANIDNNPDLEIIVPQSILKPYTGNGKQFENKIFVYNKAGQLLNTFTNFAVDDLSAITTSITAGDIDGDGINELSFAMGKRIFVLKADGTNYNSDWPKDVSTSFNGNTSELETGNIALAPLTSGNPNNNLVFVATQGSAKPNQGTISDTKVIVLDKNANIISGWPKSLAQMPNTPLSIPLNSNPTLSYSIDTPIIKDINGDNEYDVVIGNSSSISAWDIGGNPIVGFPIFVSDYHTQNKFASYISVEDLDNDGKLELIASYNNGFRDNTYNQMALYGILDFYWYDPEYVLVYDLQTTDTNKTAWGSFYGTNLNNNTNQYPEAPVFTLSTSITVPTSNQSVELNQPTTITASASIDSGATTVGVIDRVEFYEGATKLGEDRTAPYTYSWIPNTEGVSELKSKVVATNGNLAFSSVVYIFVQNSFTPITPANIISLQSCNPTYPTPVVQGVGTVNCVLKLTDNANLSYSLANLAPLNFKIGDSTASINCSQASGTSCTIDNARDTLTIANIPTYGANLGSQPLKVSSNGTIFTTFNNAVFVVKQIQYSDILSLVCDSPKSINGFTDCTVTLASMAFNMITGDIKLKINDGALASCLAFSTSITPFNTLSCPSVEVGTQAGTFKPKYVLNGGDISSGVDIGSGHILVTSTVNPISVGDIPNLEISCDAFVVNSTTTCTFPMPSNKSLPAGFRLTIGSSNTISFANVQTCDLSLGIVTCQFVPTGNGVGNIVIYANLGGANIPTLSEAQITGFNFGKINWDFSPDQGGNSPLMKSSDNTSIKVNNFRTVFDASPTNNNRYVCTLEYRSFNDRNAGSTWQPLDNSVAIPKAYNSAAGTTQGCLFNLSRAQRGNSLNFSLRVTIRDNSISNPSNSNPNTYTFYNEYIYRFLGAGIAAGT